MAKRNNTQANKGIWKKKHRAQRRNRVLLVLVLLLLLVYAIGVLFYRTHFYGSGSIFGMTIRNQSVSDMKEQVRQKVNSYSLTVTTRDGVEVISAEEAGLSYDDKGEIDALLEEQNPALWIFMFLTSEEDHDVAIVMDEDVLSETITGLACMQEDAMTSPTDAYVAYEGESFLIFEETYGNELHYETVYPIIKELVLTGESEASLDDLDCYVAPEVYQDTAELVALTEELNDLISIEITYDFSDRTWVVTGDMIAEWIVLGEDFSYELDEDAIADYVYEMAYYTDTFGLSRTFTTTYGATVSLKGGDYGWLMSQTRTKTQLIELIYAGETVTVEPEYRYTALCRETNDIGDTYVEISISAQYMWVYVDGTCVVSTPVVTGRVSSGWDTPSGGVWAIDARIQDYTLTGQDYNTEVSYWLPFNGNVGIHDATWRTEFGGTIYEKSGSHGCINTPLSAMKTVYENVKIGYPVVVY